MNFTQRPKIRVGGAAVIPRGNIFTRTICAVFPIKGDSIFEIMRKIIFIVALVCFIIFGGDALSKTVQDFKARLDRDALVKYMSNVTVTPGQVAQIKSEIPDVVDDPAFITMINEHPNFRGWIKINDTVIDYPVMQAKDNEFYLTHDFNSQKNVTGAIFADYRNDLLHKAGEHGESIVLYGHNMLKSTFFATLSRYWEQRGTLEYYKAHPVVEFDTMIEKAKWKIFAVGIFNPLPNQGEVFDFYNKTAFTSKDDFNNYISAVMDRSVLFTDVDLTYGDSILALQTCYWPWLEENQTLCGVFARKVRPGENPAVDTDKATFNNKEYRFDLQVQHMGTNWTGSVWDKSKLLSLG